MGLALDGRRAGGFGAGSVLGLALSSPRLPFGSPEGETLAENVSISWEGKPAMDMWRDRVAELRDAGGELVGENIDDSGGDA